MEVIEHVDPPRLPRSSAPSSGSPRRAPSSSRRRTRVQRPLRRLPAGALRHRDHRFEWDRAEFPRGPAAVADGLRLRRAGSLPVGHGRPGGSGRRPRWRCSPSADAGPEVPREPGALHPRAVASWCSSASRGSGKSTFARAHFKPTEVISSDFCRGLVADDENDQSATAGRVRRAALHRRQAARGRPADRRRRDQRAAGGAAPLVALAREHDVLPVAIVLDVPAAVCAGAQRRAARPRLRRRTSIRRQHAAAARVAARACSARASARCTCCGAEDEVAEATIVRDAAVQRPAARDRAVRRHRRRARLPARAARRCSASSATRWPGTRAGARWTPRTPAAAAPSSSATWSTAGRTRPACCASSWAWSPPGTRSACPATTRTSCCARCAGARCRSSHGLETTLAQLAAEPPEFRAAVEAFLDGLTSHYVLDGGRLVVAHAGLTREAAGPGVGPGPLVLPLRADDRRDRRLRPARPLPVGGGLPGPGRWCFTATRRCPRRSG